MVKIVILYQTECIYGLWRGQICIDACPTQHRLVEKTTIASQLNDP